LDARRKAGSIRRLRIPGAAGPAERAQAPGQGRTEAPGVAALQTAVARGGFPPGAACLLGLAELLVEQREVGQGEGQVGLEGARALHFQLLGPVDGLLQGCQRLAVATEVVQLVAAAE